MSNLNLPAHALTQRLFVSAVCVSLLHRRMKMRARSEEVTVGMDYLEGLHQKHEDWLGAGHRFVDLTRPRRQRSTARQPTVRLPSGLLVPSDISPRLQDSLYVLDANRSAPEMHDALNGMPALVLECDRDVLRDLDLQQQVQETVTEYIKLMRQHREQREKQQQSPQASMSNSASGVNIGAQSPRSQSHRSSVHGDVQAAVELVQDTAAEADIAVVHHSSGKLREQLQQPAGNLEALAAVSKKGASSSSGNRVLATAGAV